MADYLKNDLLQFHQIFSPLWLKQTVVFLDALNKDNYS